MFVVAILCSYYDSDAGRDDSYLLDRVFESTEGANREIARIIFEKKKEIFVQDSESEIRDRYNKLFCEKNPPPIEPDLSQKPPFDHDRERDKEYQILHVKEVERWRKEIYNPAREIWNEWDRLRRIYVNDNTKCDIEDFKRFLHTMKNEIEETSLSSYDADVKYTTKVLEVFK